MNPESSDSALLRDLSVEPGALAHLYQRHARAVHGYLARRVGTAAADDLLGEVFAAALQARERVRPHASGSALPWLYGIAGNLVRMHLRRSSPPRAPEDLAGFDWDAVDARLDAAAQRQALRAALGTLTDGERELLLLIAWEGLTPAEAAEVLGLTSVAARSRLHRARARAQAALDALAGAHATKEMP